MILVHAPAQLRRLLGSGVGFCISKISKKKWNKAWNKAKQKGCITMLSLFYLNIWLNTQWQSRIWFDLLSQCTHFLKQIYN